MKTAASLLVLSALLSTAHSQTAPPAAPRNPTPSQAKAIRAQAAARRAEAYKGPKVVSSSKELGQRMMQKSKPADGLRRRLVN